MERSSSISRLGIVLAVLIWLACTAESARSREAGSSVTIEYIAHACFRLEADETSILIDPYADRVWLGYDFPRGVTADALLITHPHYDHDAGDRRGQASPWPRGTPTVRDSGQAEFGPFTVTGVAGKHADPYGREFNQKNTLFVVEVAGIRIAHLGDTGPLTGESVLGLGRVDVLLLPIDGEEHILKNHEVATIIETLAPRIVVPMHYRHPDLEPENGPSDLGPIDPWLKGRSNVRRLQSHRAEISSRDLPSKVEVWLFDHSPEVSSPRD